MTLKGMLCNQTMKKARVLMRTLIKNDLINQQNIIFSQSIYAFNNLFISLDFLSVYLNVSHIILNR